jgi:hypothetical protein
LRYQNKEVDLDVRLGISGALGNQIEPEDPGPPVVPAYLQPPAHLSRGQDPV